MQLFVEDTVLMFHSRSKDAPPGTGVGEQLGALTASVFAELVKYTDWRKKLSNFAPAPFELDGLRWPSVEHHFQAAKFTVIDETYWRSFAVGGVIGSKDGAAAKSAGGRRGRPMTDAQIVEWDQRKRVVMRRALEAKFRANDEHRAILLATWPAKLTHRPLRTTHTQVEHELMEVRALLRKEAGAA